MIINFKISCVTEKRCYVCAYAQSRKVIGGKGCLNPHLYGSPNMIACEGKCYVSFLTYPTISFSVKANTVRFIFPQNVDQDAN